MSKLITQSSDLYVVVCRPALPKDTADVMALTREIWEGNDYVPYVWGEWLADPHGILAVAEYGGHVVGLVKLSWKGADEWWLQGLRVDPKFQGQGIASHLHDYVLEAWQRSLGGVIRLATSSARLQVHHLCQRTGFTRVGEYRWYTAPSLSGQPHPFRPVVVDETARTLHFARTSPLFAKSNGLIYLDWYWGDLSDVRLEETVRFGRAFWWSGEAGDVRGLLCIGIDEDDDQGRHPYIQLLACEEADLPDLLVDYRRLAGEMGFARAEWLAPDQEAVQQALEGAGFQSDWENSLYLFEKRQ